MKKISLALVGSALMLSGNLLFAHADLSKSNPGDGAVANKPPQKIELAFTEDVRLLRFGIADSEGQVIATEFEPSAATSTEFAIAVPGLEQDSYIVNWAIMGADGHLVEKSFTFTVDANAQESSGSVPEAAAPAAHSH